MMTRQVYHKKHEQQNPSTSENKVKNRKFLLKIRVGWWTKEALTTESTRATDSIVEGFCVIIC